MGKKGRSKEQKKDCDEDDDTHGEREGEYHRSMNMYINLHKLHNQYTQAGEH